MMKTRLVLVSLTIALSLPVFGKTYRSTYPVPCSEVWVAVKDTLNNPENYNVVRSDDTAMNAAYHVKHAVHVNVTGAILQRTNKVTLLPKGPVCEMHVVSNFSGWEHNDREDFKERVDESLSKTKSTNVPKSAEAAPPPK